MDKIVINAVAGAGKSSMIIEDLDLEKRIAILTYTRANQNELKKNVIKRFKHLPRNIHIFGLFEFLYSFCYMPLQNLYPNRGICFDTPHFMAQSYYTRDGRIYANKLSKYLIDKKVDFHKRIERYFDKIYIDEIQDLSAYDFDWMLSLAELCIPVKLVGDFYQSTFSSSRHGNKRKSLHVNYDIYKKYFTDKGYHFDETTLSASHRCSENVCTFISSNLGINISSHKQNEGIVEKVDNVERIKEILDNDDIKKLFYQKHYSFTCNSDNWGNSKGLTFKDVCVILNPSTTNLFDGKLNTLAPQTLAKLYVACSRTKGNLYFVEQRKIPNKYKI